MALELTRSFAITLSLETYCETLLKKISYNKDLQRNTDDVLHIFESLSRIEKEDETRYQRIVSDLARFTEDFIVKNAGFVASILDLDDKSEKNILSEYRITTDSLLVYIDQINEIYNTIIKNYTKDILKTFGNDTKSLREIANDIKKDQDFAGVIYQYMKEEYTNIDENSTIGKYISNLVLDSNLLVYKELDSAIGTLNKKNILNYETYKKKVITKEYIRSQASIGKPRKI